MSRSLSLLACVLLLALLGANALAEEQSETAQLAIPNMVCMSCEMQVEHAVMQVTGVSGIEFDGEAKTAIVRFDAAETSLDTILQACEDAGYPASLIEETAI